MRFRSLLCLLAGCVVLPVPAWTAEVVPTPSNAVPRLVCDQPIHDFGERDHLQDVFCAFALRNAGSAPLTIHRVRASCGCTTTALATNLLQPGQQTELSAHLTLRGRSGPQHKRIYVESDDPATPLLGLEMRGTALIEVEARPLLVQFGALAAGEKAERSVTLQGHSATVFQVTNCAVNPDYLQATLETVVTGREYRVRVALVAPAAGAIRGTLQLRTDHPRFPLVEVPVFGFVRAK
jgi:hypothetical protein